MPPADPGPTPTALAALTATPGQAALLLDVTLRPLLTLLMTRPASASEVAAHLNVGLNRAHYLLRKLHGAGIVTVESLTPRAGRAIKRYRAPGAWFIPFDVTGADTLQVFVQGQLLPRLEEIVRNALGVLQAGRTGRPGYWLDAQQLLIGDESGPALDAWGDDQPFMLGLGRVHLDPAHATELKRRLTAVIEAYAPLEAPDQPAYTLGLILVRGEIR